MKVGKLIHSFNKLLVNTCYVLFLGSALKASVVDGASDFRFPMALREAELQEFQRAISFKQEPFCNTPLSSLTHIKEYHMQ